MEQLTNLLQERLGLSEEMAAQASDVVLEFLQSKLPEPIASQLASYIGDAAENKSRLLGIFIYFGLQLTGQ